MRYKIIVLSVLFVFCEQNAFAGDEFGARFTGRAPAALGESPDKSMMEIAGPMLPTGMDINPAAIEPAAGDADKEETPKTIEKPNP